MEGYRKNVAMVVLNDKQDVLICRRKGTENWQFPQGGIDENELIEDAMYRELYEEVGLKKEDVSIELVDNIIVITANSKTDANKDDSTNKR